MFGYKKLIFILVAATALADLGCQKTTTAPTLTGVAAFTVVNAIPNTNNGLVIPVINTGSAITWFQSAYWLFYGSFYEYSPVAGNDTVYVVQLSDTLDVDPKSAGEMFYSILNLKKGGIYSLFLCGADTTSPDYLFTSDSLPFHSPTDSTVGVRFVNLSTSSSPISINLEGSPNGSEVTSLSYKSITGFRDYISNSSITNSGYLFVYRDVATGDSLASFDLAGFNNNNGVGLSDQNNGNPLVFKNVTIAFIGQPGINAVVPQSTMLIDDY